MILSKTDTALDHTLIANISDPFILSNIQAVEEVVSLLDLNGIEQCYSNRGSPHAPVAVLLRISLYNLLNGFSSPSDWARNAQTCNATRFVSRGCTPSKASLYRFRDKAQRYIHCLFAQVLQLARRDGFLDGDEVAIDGTYIEALASRHRIVNQATLAKRIQVLEQVISGATDNAQGTGKPNAKSKWMAQTDTGKLEQLDRYQQSQKELEKRLKKNRERKPSTQLDESKIFVSTSDPEVPISRNKLAVFGPLWPTQFITHVRSNLILAACVFAIPSDTNTIGSMIDLARNNGAINIRTAYADSGYSSLSDLRSCHQRSVRLVAPVGENSFTDQKKQANITRSGKQPKTHKDEFVFDYGKVQCTCPNGVTIDATKDGKRTLLNGDILQCYRINFTPEICKGCPLVARCKDGEKSTRAVKLIEGEEMLVAHKKAMTPDVLSNCRTIRAQTAEKAFGDGKERVGLRKLGCRTPARTNAITILHVLAMNVKRLFRLRQTSKKLTEK